MLNDMTSEEKSRLLIYRQELLAGKEREIAELHAKLDRLIDRLIESQKESQEAMASMTVSMAGMADELKELRLSNAEKERKIQSLTELLSRNNQTMFGSRSQKAKASESTNSRCKDMDDFDGSGDSVNPQSTECGAQDKVNQDKTRSEAQLRIDLLRTGSCLSNIPYRPLYIPDGRSLYSGILETLLPKTGGRRTGLLPTYTSHYRQNVKSF